MKPRNQFPSTPANLFSRSGFSLLELLIAMALLIAIAALLWPDFTSLGVNATRNAAVDSLQAACDVVRSRAMTRLEPVQLIAVERSDAWTLEVGPAPKSSTFEGSDNSEGSENESANAAVTVRIGELPATVGVESGGEVAGDTKSDAEESWRDAASGGSQSRRVLLALALPDGSIEASVASLVHRGHRSPVSIKRWTGRISLGAWLSEIAGTENAGTKDDSATASGDRSSAETSEDSGQSTEPGGAPR